MPANPIAVGYLRVSTERQAGETLTSLADQEHAIRGLATKLGVEVGQWYRDEGVSGSIAEDRPAFGRLLSHCRANPRSTRTPGFVLFLNASRFGRFDDPDQAAALRYELRRLGWLVRFAESDDSEDVIARSVMRAVGDAQASEYRRNLIRNVQRGKRGAAQQGFWTSREPFGYRRRVVYPIDRDRVLAPGQHKATDEKVKLTPGPADEVATVQWLFTAYGTGTHTLEELAAAMLTRAPGRRWTRWAVRTILRNQAYLGHLIAGRRSGVLCRQKVWTTDPATWIQIPDAHPALVDTATFATVQHRLGVHSPRRARGADYRVSGLITCVHCGDRYIGGGSCGQNAAGERFHYYRDRGGVDGRCAGKLGNVAKRHLEQAVIDVVAAELASGTVQAAIRRAVLARVSASASVARPDRRALQRALAQAEAKRARLVQAVADGTLTNHEARSAIETARLEIDRCRSALRPAIAVDPPALHREADRWLAIAADFPRVAREATGPELRSLITPWLAYGSFDKHTRELVLGIRAVPISLLSDVGFDEYHDSKESVRVRRVILKARRSAA